jgi:hypothetical protein
MKKRTFLYRIRTCAGVTFYLEAHTNSEAEQRAYNPAIAKTLVKMILDALSTVQSVEMHRGPDHLVTGKLVFRDEIF